MKEMITVATTKARRGKDQQPAAEASSTDPVIRLWLLNMERSMEVVGQVAQQGAGGRWAHCTAQGLL